MSTVGTAAQYIAGQSDNPSPNRVMAFEIEVEGHHPGYVRNFAQAWVRHKVPARLDFVVTPKFFQLHPDAVEAVQSLASNGVSIQAISAEEQSKMEKVPHLRYFHGWRLFCDYLEKLNVDHGLVMYYDFFQLPSVLGRRCPRPYSGIYFRPTFHYHLLDNYRPNLSGRLKSLRKKLLLSRVLRQPQLKRLYCLDEIAVDFMANKFKTDTHFKHIADSFTVYKSSPSRQEEHRENLGIEPGRRIMTLLGVLDKRKGVKELLECLSLIPEDAARLMTIVLAGRVSNNQHEEIEALVAELQKRLKIQIILHNEYIPDCEVQHYYELSDVILATYQGHMGSSSALIRAALAKKTVLSSDYGLMGELVRRRKLGMAVDTTNPAAMAKALTELATVDLAGTFDATEASKYASENSPEQLAADLAAMVQ